MAVSQQLPKDIVKIQAFVLPVLVAKGSELTKFVSHPDPYF
jgi:hypothetical protein